MTKTLPAALAAIVMMLGKVAWAADPCASFKWDVSAEVQLFAGPGTPLAAGRSLVEAPAIATGQLYVLALQPQESLGLPVVPSKKMLTDGAYGGVVRFKVPTAGTWRVAIDGGFWLDVVQDGTPLPSVDFHGSADCPGPRKVVLYALPAGVDLVLQMTAAPSADARLSVTPVAAPGR